MRLGIARSVKFLLYVGIQLVPFEVFPPSDPSHFLGQLQVDVESWSIPEGQSENDVVVVNHQLVSLPLELDVRSFPSARRVTRLEFGSKVIVNESLLKKAIMAFMNPTQSTLENTCFRSLLSKLACEIAFFEPSTRIHLLLTKTVLSSSELTSTGTLASGREMLIKPTFHPVPSIQMGCGNGILKLVEVLLGNSVLLL